MIQFNKDYKNMSEDKALDDFQHKIEHYLDVYETINPKLEARYSFIKVYDGGKFFLILILFNRFFSHSILQKMIYIDHKVMTIRFNRLFSHSILQKRIEIIK